MTCVSLALLSCTSIVSKPRNIVNRLAVRDDNLFVCGSEYIERINGVAIWDGCIWQSVGNFEFPASPISIVKDSSGVIWIGSRNIGVTKYSQGALKEYPIHLTTFLLS
jgi:hypothetical protein